MRKKGRKVRGSERKSAPKAVSASKAEKPLLNALYEKIPALPLLDRSGTAILIFSILLYVFFVAYVFLLTPPISITSSITEDPLVMNSPLSISPGEKYIYEIPVEGTVQRLEYRVAQSPFCLGTYIEEEYAGTVSDACLSRNGTALGGSLGNSSLLLFSPWMLAASENFSWKLESTVSASGAEVKNAVYFLSVGTKSVAGRDTYPVEVRADSVDGDLMMTLYVDAKKRVLVLAEGENTSIRLVGAPFPLNWERR